MWIEDGNVFSKNTQAVADVWACFTFGYTIVLPGLLFWAHGDGWARVPGNFPKKSPAFLTGVSKQYTHRTGKGSKAPKSTTDHAPKPGLRPRTGTILSQAGAALSSSPDAAWNRSVVWGKANLSQTHILYCNQPSVYIVPHQIPSSMELQSWRRKKSWFRASVFWLLKIWVTDLAISFPAPLPTNMAFRMIHDKVPEIPLISPWVVQGN